MTRRARPFLLALMLAGCGGTVATPSAPSGSVAASPSAVTSSPTPEPTPTRSPSPSPTPPGPEGLVLPDPGRPFDADGLLSLMRDSRRPGGVPEQLETRPIADALAASLWTFDGSPWATASAGGSCGPDLCTLEIGGAVPGTQGEDLYIFSVAPSNGAVEVLDASLRGVPLATLNELDTLARLLSDDTELVDLGLAGVSWLPPPDGGRFVLSYRSGGEEGSCSADLTLDAVEPELVASEFTDC